MARWLNGDRFAVKNLSTRDVVVTSVKPDRVVTTEVVNNFLALQQYPYAVNAGDLLEFDTERNRRRAGLRHATPDARVRARDRAGLARTGHAGD